MRPTDWRVGRRSAGRTTVHAFEKGYTPNWTEEVFIVDRVLPTNPITSRIRDLVDEPIVESFYAQQLQKTDQVTFRIAAEADPVATRITLPDEEDWKLVSKVPPRKKKRAVLYVRNLHNDQDESTRPPVHQ